MGLHFKIPVIERVAKVVSLKEQVVDFPPQPVITKDNVTMQIDTVLYFQITDPKMYAYGVEYPMAAIENLSVTTMRNIIGDMDLEQTLTSRDTINTPDAPAAGRSHGPLGHQGQPRGGQEHPAAPRYPERHGKTDEGRAGKARSRAPGPRARSRARSWWPRANAKP